MIPAWRRLARLGRAHGAALALSVVAVAVAVAVPCVAGPAHTPQSPQSPQTARAATAAAAAGVIDANRATEAQLQTVKGIGPAIAARILEARRDGPFHDLADLEARVKGVGPANIRRFAQAGLVVGAPASGAARLTGGGLSGGGSAAHSSRSSLTPPGPTPPGPTPVVTPLGKGQIREWSAPPGVLASGSATPAHGSRP